MIRIKDTIEIEAISDLDYPDYVVKDEETIYVVNYSAGCILDYIQKKEGCNIDEIKEATAMFFDTSQAIVGADIDELMEEFSKIGIVEYV